jgi:hypothetical protein
MGMWTTDNQDALNDVLKAFDQASKAAHDAPYGYAYQAGYLNSVIISLVPDLPKRVQKRLIEDMIKATQRLEKLAIDRMTEDRH